MAAQGFTEGKRPASTKIPSPAPHDIPGRYPAVIKIKRRRTN